MLPINSHLLLMIASVFGCLGVGTAVRLVSLRNAESEVAAKRLGSLKVWWVLAGLLSIAAIGGRAGVSVLLAVASLMGLREMINLIDRQAIRLADPEADRGEPSAKAAESRSIPRPLLVAVYLAVPFQFTLTATRSESTALAVLPALSLIGFSVCRLLSGQMRGYLRLSGSLYWSVMLLVYCLSHGVLLLNIAPAATPSVGDIGWFLYVLIITETDDIAQALTGRRLGRHKITPRTSPNKTWEGFLGGVLTSVVLASLLAPWLTTFPAFNTTRGMLLSIGSGLVIVIAAFFGDINMSAVKRDVGVKDGSSILPGMGGIIDRIDSLTFTAPAMYWFLRCVL